MRVVVDTNIAFSAILHTNNKAARIILMPRTGLNFYSTHQLLQEIDDHSGKIIHLSGYTRKEFEQLRNIISKKITFISPQLIPTAIWKKSEELTHGIDPDDTEFVALTEQIKGRLWTGDRRLSDGLARKGWKKCISTTDLYLSVFKKSKGRK